MFATRRCCRIRRSLFTLGCFTIVALILYKKLQYEEKHKQEKHSVPSQDHILFTKSPPLRAWVVVHVTSDFCLSLANTFSDWLILQYGDFEPSSFPARDKRCHYLTSHQMLAGSSPRFQAFLYVIKMGAEAIYIHPTPRTANDITFPRHIDLRQTMDGLSVTSSNSFFSPLQHWGCNYTKFPSQLSSQHYYSLCKGLMPAIQAATENLDQENSLMAHTHIAVSEYCDTASPDIVLASGTYANYHQENILYMKDAFWSLPIMELYDPSDEMCFKLLVQKLLWLTGRNLLLFSGFSLQSTASVQRDMITKCRTYLDNSNCDDSVDFISCARSISDSLATVLLRKTFVHSLTTWLETLQQNGKDLPHISPHLQLDCEPDMLLYMPVQHKVPYQVKKWRIQPFPPVNNINLIRITYENTCKRKDIKSGIEPDFLAPWTIWENVLLIVVFNNPFYDVIPYLEVLYRSFFPHMLYCGPTVPNRTMYDFISTYNISFVSYGVTPEGHRPGSFNYKCLMMAIQMRYHVHGYLVIADDLLIIPRWLKSLNLRKAWFIPKKSLRTADIRTLRECRLGMCDFFTTWRWWEDYQDATIKAFEEMKSRQKESILIHTCLKTLISRNNGEFRVNGGYSDIYYIPVHLADGFVELFSIFLKHYVFLEIAVPTGFRCLVSDADLEAIQGKQIWDESRDAPWIYFTKHDLAYKSYLHPTKWSFLNKDSIEYNQFFCSAVSYIHDPYSRMNEVHLS